MTLSRLNAKQQMKSIWRLGGLSVRDLAHSTWNEIIDGEISSQASGLAFNFILAIFPLLMFLVTLFALFASRGTQLSANFFLYLSHVLPLSAFRLVSATIAEIVERASSSRIFFEIITTLWFASGGMSSIISALNNAYLIHDRRSWFKVRGISIVLTIAISVLILSALVLLLIGNAIATFLGSHIPHGSPILTIWHVFQYPLAVFFVVISFALIYYYGPDLEFHRARQSRVSLLEKAGTWACRSDPGHRSFVRRLLLRMRAQAGDR